MKKIRIRIKKPITPRSGVIKSKVFRDKKKYRRLNKNKNLDEEE